MDDADLRIDVPDEVYRTLHRWAEASGRTPDEEAHAILLVAFQTNPDPSS